MSVLAVAGVQAAGVVSAPSGDVSLVASPGTVTAFAGRTTSFSLTASAVQGFTGAVTLGVTAPTGVAVAASPGRLSLTRTAPSARSTVSLAVAGSALPGAYPIAVTATSGRLTRSVTVQLRVPGLQASLAPAAVNLAPGGSTTARLTVNAVAGLTGTTIVLPLGLPAGITATVAPSAGVLDAAAPTWTAGVTFAATSRVAPGGYPGRFLVIAGGAAAVAPFTITVARPASLAVSATTASQVVPPGTPAQYALSVTRAASTPVTLAATGLPSGVAITFSPRQLTGTGTSAVTLSASPSAATAEGRYPFTVTATAGAATASTALTLVVERRGLPFTVTGPVAPLTQSAPGVSAPLNLSLSNPSATDLHVSSLTVTLTSTSSAACPVAGNYLVTQFGGAYPLTVPAGQTRTLQQLGVPASAWPQLQLIDLPINQDGCKGATVDLAFGGFGYGGVTA